MSTPCPEDTHSIALQRHRAAPRVRACGPPRARGGVPRKTTWKCRRGGAKSNRIRLAVTRDAHTTRTLARVAFQTRERSISNPCASREGKRGKLGHNTVRAAVSPWPGPDALEMTCRSGLAWAWHGHGGRIWKGDCVAVARGVWLSSWGFGGMDRG